MHAFLVQLRNKDGSLHQGVEISDCGIKQGLNGVDNGKIRFKNVIVPRENLLNKIADVSPTGEYSTQVPIDKVTQTLFYYPDLPKRFTYHIGELVVARIGTSCIANTISAMGLSIALKYAFHRTQFGASPAQVWGYILILLTFLTFEKGEDKLISFSSHQRRLFPHIATLFAHTFALQNCKVRKSLLANYLR